jgi:hypothetical protein
LKSMVEGKRQPSEAHAQGDSQTDCVNGWPGIAIDAARHLGK